MKNLVFLTFTLITLMCSAYSCKFLQSNEGEIAIDVAKSLTIPVIEQALDIKIILEADSQAVEKHVPADKIEKVVGQKIYAKIENKGVFIETYFQGKLMQFFISPFEANLNPPGQGTHYVKFLRYKLPDGSFLFGD